MKKLLATTALSAVIAGCGQTQPSNISQLESHDLSNRQLVHLDYINKVEGDNVVWSAASLDGMLLLLGGAYDEQTKQSLEGFLGASIEDKAAQNLLLNSEVEGLLVSSANNIWVREGINFLPGYTSFLSENFGFTPETLDMGQPEIAASIVNGWAADNTNDMINHVVSPDTFTANLVSLMANALYFKGTWKEEFDADNTEDRNFNVVDVYGEKTTKELPTMLKRNAEVEVARHGDNVTVRLPYKGETHAMYLSFAANRASEFSRAERLTHVNTSVNVLDVYQEMIVQGGAFDLDSFSSESFDVFTMPKFTINTEVNDMQVALQQHGFSDLFAPGALANMSDDARFYLGFIKQVAKIIVNEEGTEAAAVTIGGIRATSFTPPTNLKVDGPFAFAIRDEVNDLTLFEGVVRSPEAE